VVVEDRYSQLFRLEHVRPAVVADGLAELQIRWPSIPIVFCETRPLAEEWTYRYLAAALTWATTGQTRRRTHGRERRRQTASVSTHRGDADRRPGAPMGPCRRHRRLRSWSTSLRRLAGWRDAHDH